MKTIAEIRRDDGRFPNSALPLVAFLGAFDPAGGDLARRIEGVFAANGRTAERPGADERIARVAPPRMDPVHGAGGPLLGLWRSARPGKP